MHQRPLVSASVRAGIILLAPLLAQAQAPSEPRLALRSCAALSTPKKLPAADQVADSAGLAATLCPFAEAGKKMELVLSVPAARTLPQAVYPLPGTPGLPSDSLLRLVQAALRADLVFDAPSIRLRLKIQDPPGLAVERSQLCPPVSVGPEKAFSVTTGVTSDNPAPPRIRSPVIRLRIGAEGRVVMADLLSSSGRPDLDEQILRTMRDVRYYPAVLDGRPVEVWFERGKAELVR